MMLNSVVFWYLTRDRHKDGIGAGSYGYGGLKGGNHIYFERQKTGGSKVIILHRLFLRQWTLQIIFLTNITKYLNN